MKRSSRRIARRRGNRPRSRVPHARNELMTFVPGFASSSSRSRLDDFLEALLVTVTSTTK